MTQQTSYRTVDPQDIREIDHTDDRLTMVDGEIPAVGDNVDFLLNDDQGHGEVMGSCYGKLVIRIPDPDSNDPQAPKVLVAFSPKMCWYYRNVKLARIHFNEHFLHGEDY
jgi:hypothetical protein